MTVDTSAQRRAALVIYRKRLEVLQRQLEELSLHLPASLASPMVTVHQKALLELISIVRGMVGELFFDTEPPHHGADDRRTFCPICREQVKEASVGSSSYRCELCGEAFLLLGASG